MPGGDRTGPRGMGPMTGRGLGSCYASRPCGLVRAGYGRFGAYGFGRGRGWRNRYYATGVPGWAVQQTGFQLGSARDELGYIRKYTSGLQDEINALKAQMAELKRTQRTG